MYSKPPDFFLGSSEHRGDWARARACWITDHLRMEDENECVLADVDPPIIGQPFGLGDKDITSLILVGVGMQINLTQQHKSLMLMFRA